MFGSKHTYSHGLTRGYVGRTTNVNMMRIRACTLSRVILIMYCLSALFTKNSACVKREFSCFCSESEAICSFPSETLCGNGAYKMRSRQATCMVSLKAPSKKTHRLKSIRRRSRRNKGTEKLLVSYTDLFIFL